MGQQQAGAFHNREDTKMNLAELRQKAKKAKDGIDLCPSAPEMAPTEPVNPPIQPVRNPVYAPSGPIHPIAGSEEGSPGGEALPLPPPKPFDPLAVLLAGRQAVSLHAEDREESVSVNEAAGEEYEEFLCFKVSSEMYAINIMGIKEIIKPREVTEVPRAPSFIVGVLSLRGIIIPLLDMRLRLGLPPGEKSPRERIIVLKRPADLFGIVVDEVVQVVKITAATIEKPPAVLEGIDRDFVAGIGRCGGQMLILLNQEKIVDLTLF